MDLDLYSPISSESLYMEEFSNHKIMTAEEERKWLESAQSGDKTAIDEIIRRNQRLVIKIARRYESRTGKSLQIMDLIQWGNQGLLIAIERFDLSMNVKFSTYATWWIRQSVRKNALKNGQDFTVSYMASQFIPTIARARTKLAQSQHREPTMEEIAAEAGISLRHVQEVWEVFIGTVSLDNEVDINGDGEVTVSEVIPSDFDRNILEDNIDQKDLIKAIFSAMTKLDAQSKQIIDLYFGINGEKEHTMLEISKIMRCSIALVDTKIEKILKLLHQILSLDSVISTYPDDVQDVLRAFNTLWPNLVIPMNDNSWTDHLREIDDSCGEFGFSILEEVKSYFISQNINVHSPTLLLANTAKSIAVRKRQGTLTLVLEPDPVHEPEISQPIDEIIKTYPAKTRGAVKAFYELHPDFALPVFPHTQPANSNENAMLANRISTGCTVTGEGERFTGVKL